MIGADRSEHPGRRGLRPRPVYLLVSMTLIGGAAYVAIGSVANYVRHEGYVSDIAWLLATALIVAVVALRYGVVSGRVFVTWPTPPPGLDGVLAGSPLTTRPARDGSLDRVRRGGSARCSC